MAIKKYINVSEVVKLTGRSRNEIINLVQTGVIPAHKARKGHWRLNVPNVENYFGILINEPIEVIVKPKSKTKPKHVEVVTQPTPKEKHRTPSVPRLIINEDHYQEVIKRICAAKSSIRIMTANFKLLNLKPTQNQGERYKDGTPFISSLKDKAVQGVSVQIICSQPTSLVCDELKECYQQINNSNLFDYKFCIRNHAKVVIIDDTIAYIGSANATRAGIGQYTPGNFEVGILTDKPELVSTVKTLFSMIWDGEYCKGCHRADKCPEY